MEQPTFKYQEVHFNCPYCYPGKIVTLCILIQQLFVPQFPESQYHYGEGGYTQPSIARAVVERCGNCTDRINYELT